MIKAILACEENGGIGLNGAIPWPHIEVDFQWFMNQTKHAILVMGRVTWQDSQLSHPIPDRRSYVVTRHPSACTEAAGIIQGDVCNSILELQTRYPEETIWIIGGVGLVETTLPIIQEFYLSRVVGHFECDRFLPLSELNRWPVRWQEQHSDVTFQILENPSMLEG